MNKCTSKISINKDSNIKIKNLRKKSKANTYEKCSSITCYEYVKSC